MARNHAAGNPIPPTLILVMGPSGAGKSTVGQMLSDRLDARFIDADDYCSQANRNKMQRGIALTDADRVAWHSQLNRVARELLAEHAHVVLACSAHRACHREVLLAAIPQYRILFLTGALELIRNRVAARTHHFFPPSLVAHQFSILEPPVDAIRLDVAQPVGDLVERALCQLAQTC